MQTKFQRAADAAEKYKRKKKPLGFNPFSYNQTELINKKIRHINRLFKEKGLPKLPGSYIQHWDEQNLHQGCALGLNNKLNRVKILDMS